MLGLSEYFTRRRGRLALYGGVGALYGGGAMSLIRLGLRRAGLIDKMVPQAVSEWAARKLGVEPPGLPVGHPVADQLVHLTYSLAWGAALRGPNVSFIDARLPQSVARGGDFDTLGLLRSWPSACARAARSTCSSTASTSC